MASSSNAQLFKQIDRLTKELKESRLEAERANERARWSKCHGEDLKRKFQEARLKVDEYAASWSATQRQHLLEALDKIVDPGHDDSCSLDSADVLETNIEVSTPEQEVEQRSTSHTSAPDSDVTPNPACGVNMAQPEDLRLVDSCANISIAEAEWKPNVSRCHLCDNAFTLFRRRHHCRSCGHCVCADCSPFRVYLESFAHRPERRISVGSFVGSLSSKSDSVAMSRPSARRVCTLCHGVGTGSFVGQGCC